MEAYRIENSVGYGPYYTDTAIHLKGFKDCMDPYQDGLGGFMGEWGMEARFLYPTFDHVMDTVSYRAAVQLGERGFHLSRYTLHDGHYRLSKSGSQVCAVERGMELMDKKCIAIAIREWYN
jgi:hypothetical protein